jgi:hypothetical protein
VVQLIASWRIRRYRYRSLTSFGRFSFGSPEENSLRLYIFVTSQSFHLSPVIGVGPTTPFIHYHHHHHNNNNKCIHHHASSSSHDMMVHTSINNEIENTNLIQSAERGGAPIPLRIARR